MATIGLLAVIGSLWFWASPRGFDGFWNRNPLVAGIMKEHDLVEQKAKFVSIATYYPYFRYFAGIVAGIEQPRKEWMNNYYLGRPYIFYLYYLKVVEMFPGNDAGHFLLGYSEYYAGDVDLAREQFERSVELDPYLYWSYFDLAVICFRQGDYAKSAETLSHAFSFRKEFSLQILRQNFFYGQIWDNLADPPRVLGNNLNEGQEEGAILLTVYFVKIGKYDQALKLVHYIGQGSYRHQEIWRELYQKAVNKQSETGDIDRLIKEQVPVRLF